MNIKELLSCIFCTCLLASYSLAQTVVQDKANNGQLKRMVYSQWNDWQPTPDLHWYGLPKNMAGWTYWRVLHHNYWSGTDRRPYKTGGVFQQNYISELAQQSVDKKLNDTVNAMMQIYLSTDMNMTGGALDLPYEAYFGNKFAGIFKEIDHYKDALSKLSLSMYNQMLGSPAGKNYFQTLDILKERINTVHNLYVDKGDRMIDYFKILDDLQPLCEKVKAFISAYIHVAQLPAPEKVEHYPASGLDFKSDEAIMRALLKNWQSN
ncbi:hypothetical protein [Arachidicoccus soli]|uniref:Uncharacterized protein n=1 Tax=Arachidicoccus soli TaxID=2341117 RepID=A0A386HT28_9BACT|nr:hypothetical protein [Arachidicoccus soli]AYD49035.1 hypothetical protein D6B99_16280 [Arachidicoccus soli]